MNATEYKSVRKWFKNYINRLMIDSPENRIKIKNKALHCVRTAKIVKKLSKSIKIRKQEIITVEAAALVHDIGKIRQYSDKNPEDHGIYGKKVLEKCNFFRDSDDKEYIFNIVEFHNNCKLPDMLDPVTKKYLKLLRDADKLDLLYIITESYKNNNFSKQWITQNKLPDNPCISERIKISLLNEETADYSDVKNNNDMKCLFLSWIYDINFIKSFKILKKMKIVEKIFKKVPENKDYKDISIKINFYIKEKINGFNNSK